MDRTGNVKKYCSIHTALMYNPDRINGLIATGCQNKMFVTGGEKMGFQAGVHGKITAKLTW